MFRALGLGVLLVLAFAARASALVVFDRPVGHEIVVARDDGSRARVVAHGYLPVVAPDGRHVAYLADRPRGSARMVSTRGGRSWLLQRDVADTIPAVYWSPDARYLAVGTSNGGAWIHDVVKKRRRYVALRADFFGGAVFSPNSATALLLGTAIGADNTLLGLRIGRRGVRDLGNGDLPVWGRGGLATEQHDGSKYEPTTYSQVVLAHRLGGPTRTLIRSAPGLYPVGWSADGTRLLVQQETPRGLRALLLSPATATQQTLPKPLSTIDAITRDGRRVLAQLNQDVVTEGLNGKIKTLAHHARNASWTQ